MEREKQRQMERQQKKSIITSEDESNSQTATDTPPLSGAHMVNNKVKSTLVSSIIRQNFTLLHLNMYG